MQSQLVNQNSASEFLIVSPAAFKAQVALAIARSAFYRENLTLLPDYENHACWLSRDAQTGFALSPLCELINVFSLTRARGHNLMCFALQTSPTLHLNCIGGGYLEQLYSRHGFEVYRREPNWTPGQPDVIFMKKGDFTP